MGKRKKQNAAPPPPEQPAIPALTAFHELEWEPCTLETTELPLNEHLNSPEPTDELIASLRTYGQAEPIKVCRDRHGYITVLAGNRRVKAARKLGWTSLNALATEGDPERLEHMLLIAVDNSARSANLLTDLQVLTHLKGKGLPLSMSGLTAQRRKRAEKLLGLDPIIREAVRVGRVAPGTAEAICALSDTRQTFLRDQLVAGKKVSAKDVAHAKASQIRELMADVEQHELEIGPPPEDHKLYVVLDAKGQFANAKARKPVRSYDAAQEACGPKDAVYLLVAM